MESKREELLFCRQLITAGKVIHPSAMVKSGVSGQRGGPAGMGQWWPDAAVTPQVSLALLALRARWGWGLQVGRNEQGSPPELRGWKIICSVLHVTQPIAAAGGG